MVPAESVRSILYNFAMYSFRDFAHEAEGVPFRHDACQHILSLLETAEFITAEEVTTLPKKQKKVLYEMITAYISFLTLPEWPPFPSNFLLGSSETRLNTPILRYMFEHSDHVLDFYQQVRAKR